ncbi:uncharacterized protein LOC123261472 [Cotesia glomerata]|nr:uncharacterized protein LOC123261472 [Cotesia glomerata]
MTKISQCVNEFLKTTRVKVTAKSISKNSVMPLQGTLSCDSVNAVPLSAESPQFLERRKDQSKIDEFVEEKSNQKENKEIFEDEDSKIDERGYEIIDFVQKRVCFFDTKDDEDNVDIEYRRTPRPRAPSIAVASSVPSFGRIVSSFESTDSLENSLLNASSTDNNIPLIRLETEKKEEKLKANFLNIPDVKKPTAAFYPRVKHQDEPERKVGFTKAYEAKGVRYSRKLGQWPKKSIVHILRALKLMKTRDKNKRKAAIDRGKFSGGLIIQESSCSSVDHDLTDRSLDSRSDVPLSDKSSSTSSCSYSSVRKRLINNSFAFQEKTSEIIETVSKTVQLYNSGIDDHEPINKSEVCLQKIPKIGGMYSRRKSDKCLACLHLSVTKNPACLGELANFHDKVNRPASPTSEELIIDELNHILRKDSSFFRDDFNSERTSNVECSDIQSELFEDNRADDKPESFRINLSVLEPKNREQIENCSSSNLTEFKKPELISDKKSVVSSKSYMSTLSLTSDRSKTTSDMEDSDQAADEGGMEEGIGESKSGLLAPCHAPLNLRPSLEPLKALRSKKARSIQSRMTSLEKSTNIESDDKTEEEDIPTTAAKINDNNKTAEDKTAYKGNDNQANHDFATMENNKYLGADYCKEPGEFADVIDKFKFRVKDKSFRRLVINQIEETICGSNSGLEISVDEIFDKLNVSDEMLEHDPSDSFRAFTLIIADSEVLEIFLDLLLERTDRAPTFEEIMSHLTSVFAKRLEKQGRKTRETLRAEKATKRLLALLVNSKQYVGNRSKTFDNDLPCKQRAPINFRQLRRVLPVQSYNLIAPILGIPSWHPKHWTSIKDARKLKIATKTSASKVKSQPSVRFSHRQESEIEFDLVVHPPSLRKSPVEDDLESHKKQMNPYVSFLLKPRRKAVIWRPLTESDLEGYDPDATLNKRTGKVTDSICVEFCQWLRNLGGFDTTVDEQVLKDMFETDFTVDISKVMQMSQKELPVVPSAVAQIRNCPEAGELEKTRWHLMGDAKAETRKTRLVGFGSTLPRHLKYVPPNNKVEANWLVCEYIPHDLESMETVWKGITHLDSVKGFVNWLNTNSQVKPPEILESEINFKLT